VSERVNRLGDVNNLRTPRPLLTIEEFFEGNDAIGSIGCNLDNEPTPAEFYELFKAISLKPWVKDIRVVVTVFDTPEWPFSDNVLIMTSAAPAEVHSWFPERLRPDDVDQGDLRGCEPYKLPEGTRPVVCFWD